MEIKIHQPDYDKDHNIVLVPKPIDYVKVSDVCVMSIDGSTATTGVAILRERDGALLFTCAFTREKDETAVQYKVRLKKAVNKILLNNALIETVYYEEPFIGYASAAKNLLMLRTFVEELIVENEPILDYIKHAEINNKRWKKEFLKPDKCPTGTDKEKAAVRAKLEGYMPFLKSVTQDEIDAISMGFVAAVHLRDGTAADIESKRITPFKYNSQFIAADCDEDMLVEFADVYKGPAHLLDNGISLTSLDGRANFDKHVYKEMADEDKVLIIKFKSSTYGNLILQHRIGHLSVQFDYIYAIIWRASRK